MSKTERVDYGNTEAGIGPDSWGMVGIFTLVVAIGLIFAAVVWSQRPRPEPTSPSGTGIKQSFRQDEASSTDPMAVSPESGAITAHDHFYPRETPETLPEGHKKVRAWWSIDKKVALVAYTDKKGTQFVAMIDDKKRLHNGWNEASGKISRPEVYAVPHDKQVDGSAGFELDGSPWVLQSAPDTTGDGSGASILMADALLQVPHKEDLQDIKIDETHRIGVKPK